MNVDGRHRLEEAWQEHAKALLRYVQGRVSDRTIAADLVQEVYLRLHQSEWPDNVRAWLFKVAARLIIDHHRAVAVRSHSSLTEELAAEETPAAVHARRELAQCLPAMLAKVPPPYRDALISADLENMPHKALAEQCGISLSAAKSRVQRARRLLRKTLEACCIFEKDPRGRIIDFLPMEKNSCVLLPPRSSS